MSGFGTETPTMGIGRLLGENYKFYVPHHQRDFSWTEDEIDQYFNDVQEARASSQEEYFIGLMVFMPSDNQREFIILDGQQRLATTVIILSTIRKWFRENGFIMFSDQVQRDFIASTELGEQEPVPRLYLNENNNTMFRDYVIQEVPLTAIEAVLSQLRRYDPNRQLLEAIKFCNTKISQMISSESTIETAKDELLNFVRFLRDNVKTVSLSVPNEANAYTVFETLNDRGLDLSILDLVKNYMFGRAGSTRLSEVQVNWAQMMANLVNVPADEFLKVYWTSRYGRVQKAQLFNKFKSEVNTVRKVRETSEDMLEASEKFAALEISDDPVWGAIDDTSRRRIQALKIIGGKQFHPILLSALDRFNTRELQRLLRLLEVFIVRYQLIGGGRTGRLEISSASVAVNIFQNQLQTATTVFQAIQDIYPSDDEFRISFLTKQEKNNRKAKYILRILEIEAESRTGSSMGQELEPSVTLTIEHILPKNPGSDWDPVTQADSTISGDCTYRLGNMCLLTNVNRSLGNISFTRKLTAYSRSNLELTNNLSQYSQWNRASIEHRQQLLTSLAVDAWRFS